MKSFKHSALLAFSLGLAATGCFSDAPEGLAQADDAHTTVKFDFLHKPLPEIPLPNDVATRYDPDSATLRRVNASMIAPTALERRTRTLLDGLDGWGLFQPITVPFTGPLDIQSILDAHRDADYDFSDDVICADLEKKGYKHFLSASYVHHIGSSTIGRNAYELTLAAKPWIDKNRPTYAKEWF